MINPHDPVRDHYFDRGWTRCRRGKSLTAFGWADDKVCPHCGQHLTPSGGGAQRHVDACLRRKIKINPIS